MKVISLLLIPLLVQLHGITKEQIPSHFQADTKVLAYGSLELVNNSGTSTLETDEERNMYLFIAKLHLGGGWSCDNWQLNKTLYPGKSVRYEVSDGEKLLVRVCLVNDACKKWKEYTVVVGQSRKFILK